MLEVIASAIGGIMLTMFMGATVVYIYATIRFGGSDDKD